MTLLFRLIVEEEERFVFPDRAAKGSAELVQVKLLPECGEVAARVELRVAQELKQRSVVLVRSRLGGHQNGRTGPCSPLGGVVVLQHLEFLDGIDRRQNRNSAGRQLVVVVTIEQPVRALGARSADGK